MNTLFDMSCSLGLLGQLDPSQWGHWLLVVLEVAIGLGTVIFVHELGHFAVAKMCGVKCEKFFIGFDIGGYKISKQWGETEYGIGILPLGGYVKMLGQDDNPANIAEQVRESEASGAAGNVETKTITGPDGQKYQVDKRSYLAKSVPQRMAIISAGVIMNIIFAFIFAVIAFGLGVPYMPSIASSTAPGSAAWEAGLRPGDEIVQAGSIRNPSFQDLMSTVTLGDMENGVEFKVRRGEETHNINLKPRKKDGKLAIIGVASPRSLKLASIPNEPPAVRGTPAYEASIEEGQGFQAGDYVVAVDGQPVETNAEYESALLQRAGQPVDVTVLRGGETSKDKPQAKPEGGKEVVVKVAPNPKYELGLVMRMGRIVAVQQDSPAAAVRIQPGDTKIKPGDFIDEITDASGNPLPGAPTGESNQWDPLELPDVLARLAEDNQSVQLTLRHDDAAEGRQPTQSVVVSLRPVRWTEGSGFANAPVAATALGVAYQVLNRVASVKPDGPAAESGIKSGDLVMAVKYLYPESATEEEKKGLTELKFNEKDGHNWPAMVNTLPYRPAGTKLQLTLKRGDEKVTATITPVASEEFFDSGRGLIFESVQRIRKAENFNEQIKRGYEETVGALGMVYRFLGKLIDGQVPLTALGGPVTIAKAAGSYAFEGTGKLLIFLTMLSANLAVINFLPIPLLDGGHMVFLAYEGLRGRPASEKFVVALHTVGFVAILSLMAYVLSLDFGLIDRGL